MSKLSKFGAIVALLALLAGPVMACVMAQAPAGMEQGACAGQMGHECESALTAGSPACCTVSSQENPYVAVRVEGSAPVWTPDAHGVAVAAVVEGKESLVHLPGGLFAAPSSPPSSISVLRI